VKAIHEGVADINLFSQITEETGDAFARELKFIEEFENVDETNIHINNLGGSIFGALSITAAMRNSGMLIRTINEGVSASIAGVILTAGDEREGVDFGRVMLHAGKIVNEETGEVIPLDQLDENQREGLKQFNEMMKEILENNTRLSQKDIKNIMESGKDVFFNSVEAKKKGIIDKRIVTSRKHLDKMKGLLDIAAVYQASSEIINENKKIEKENLTKPKPYKMEKIKALLGLDSNVSEEVVEKAIGDLNAKLEKVDGESKTLTDLKAEIKELKDAKIEADKAEATTYVEAKIKEGFYDEKKKDDLVAAAEANLDGFKLQTEAMKTPHASIKGKIDLGSADKDKEGDDGEEKLEFPKNKDGGEISLRDLDKSDPKALLAIKEKTPDVYYAMWEKQYGNPHADAPEKVEA